MSSTPSLRSFPNVVCVPVLVWLTMAFSLSLLLLFFFFFFRCWGSAFKEDHQALFMSVHLPSNRPWCNVHLSQAPRHWDLLGCGISTWSFPLIHHISKADHLQETQKKKNQISSDVILVFPLNLWEWWHVWSGCHFTRKSSGCCVSLLLFPLFGGCNLLGCAVSLHVGCASLAAYCSPHPNWSLITEPSVHKLWVPLLVCCFPEWEAWSLDLPCLLAILDCAFPIFKNFFCLVCLWEI